ncbi:MAG: cupin domain-containing protein [Proteobacteria bacterium]|nr:cupin domain-containing protein [Pseudomonadota bacterium]
MEIIKEQKAKEKEHMEQVNVIDAQEMTDEKVNKVTNIKTDQLGQDTYYFKAGQILDYHRHPEGDQIFFVHAGEGTYFLDAGTEETTELKPGVIVLAPKNVWHKIEADSDLTVSQATALPSGMEVR